MEMDQMREMTNTINKEDDRFKKTDELYENNTEKI
jgi:hypothetical protein